MTGRTHDLAAVTALGAVAILHPIGMVRLSTVIAALIANQIGGILPDIDQPTAPLWKNLPIARLFGKFAGRLLGGHRFLTHSILGIVLFGSLARMLLAFIHPLMPNVDVGLVWWAFIIGVVSHLLMDSLTEEGVPWLLPIPVKFGFPPVKRWRIKTGQWFEKLVVFPGLILIVVWLTASHYQYLVQLIHQKLVS